jgi:hypothetical protein
MLDVHWFPGVKTLNVLQKIDCIYWHIKYKLHLCRGKDLKDERPTSNIERPTSNEKTINTELFMFLISCFDACDKDFN